MLKRCWPRRIVSLVIGKGKVFSGLLSGPLPVYKASSLLRCPRATVPSIRGRAERPSPKKSLGRSGMYFGGSCISWRHPQRAATANTKTMWDRPPGLSFRQQRQARRPIPLESVRNFRDLPGLQALQKLAGPVAIEQGVGGFDAQEEPVARCQSEPRH